MVCDPWRRAAGRRPDTEILGGDPLGRGGVGAVPAGLHAADPAA